MKVTEESLAPIVLFAYNRPEHIRQTVKSLQENELATESELFIYSDGPKDDTHSKSNVAKVRRYLKTITGFDKITIVESEQNKGLANSVIQGVTDIVDQYGKVIVMEDDLETSSDFLKYMNEALNVYEDEQQVMQIAGHMFNVLLNIDIETDAVFLPFTNSIGWATWKRSWDLFDPLMSGYKEVKENENKRYRFDLDGTFSYFQMLESQLEGNVDSWAIRWYLSVFLNNGLVLYPVKSLVRHIGFDEQGTHAKRDNGVYATCCSRLPGKKVRFPPVVQNCEAYNSVKMCLASKPKRRGNNRLVFAKTFINKITKFFRV